MIKTKLIPPRFLEFVKWAPEELQQYIERSKETYQSKKWHPEFTVYNHIVIVYNRAKRLNNMTLAVAAFFHDLGKMDTTVKRSEDVYNTAGHDLASTKLVEKYKTWIESLGADYDIVHFVVKQHMRVKIKHEMRLRKRQELENHPHYMYLDLFTDFDNMKIDYSNDLEE